MLASAQAFRYSSILVLLEGGAKMNNICACCTTLTQVSILVLLEGGAKQYTLMLPRVDDAMFQSLFYWRGGLNP